MVELKGLHVVKTKGNTYYYAWRGGPRILAPLGTPEFLEEWKLAKQPEYAGDESRFATWVEKFRRSDEFKRYAKITQYRWGSWLDKIEVHFGKLSLAQFDRKTIRTDIKTWRNKWRDKPRTADYGKQVLSRVLSYCVDNEKLNTNQCSEITNLYSSDRSEIIWEPDDLAALCAAASKQVADVAKLAAFTGLRQGDLLRLSWSHIGKTHIEVKTSKSRRRRTARIPLTQPIRDLLETIPKKSTQVLTNSRGQPWRGFSSSWDDAVADAGLTGRDLHFHDLRGTAATNFFIAGFSIRQIAEIMGWSEDKVDRMIDRYVRKNEDTIRRLEVLQQAKSPNENNGA